MTASELAMSQGATGSSTLAFIGALHARVSNWFLRIPIAVLIWSYGAPKFPSALTEPGSYGVPAPLFVLNAFAEVLGPIALIVGGVVETWRPKNRLIALLGDIVTRLGAFAIGSAVVGVIIYFYWESLSIKSPHVMYLGIALYMLLRGNSPWRGGKTES